MPGIEGEEIIKLLKGQKQTAKIPIIVISALNDTPEIAKKVVLKTFYLNLLILMNLFIKLKNTLKVSKQTFRILL